MENTDNKTIHEITNDFALKIEGLYKTTPITLGMLEKNFKIVLEKYEDIIKNHAEILSEEKDDEGKTIKKTIGIPNNKIDEFEKIKKRLDLYENALNLLPKSIFVGMISAYDAFLSKLVKTFFELKPELINALNRNFSLSEIREYKNIDEISNLAIEKEIEDNMRGSHEQQIEWIEKRFNIADLKKKLEPEFKSFIEITERRNLFVHCDGVISDQYVKTCDKHGINRKFQKKDSLKVDRKYLKESHNVTYIIGVKISQLLWRNLFKNDLERADNSLIEITFELLKAEEYQLAIILLSFAKDLKHYSNVERIVFLLNLAIAYKWNGNNEDCLSIINSEDWSAIDSKYKLAVFVLRDEFEAAKELMIDIGNKFAEEDYKTWPLFKEFRKSKIFQDAFLGIYKKPFNSETVKIKQENKTQKPKNTATKKDSTKPRVVRKPKSSTKE